jgi:flagellar biosynthesis/type III secretory pathway protein FliH
VLATLDAALPKAAAQDAVALATATAAALRPALATRPEAVLYVAPALVDRVAAAVTFLPVQADPALPPGDARLAWRDGEARADLAARRRAIRDALAGLGLPLESEA